MKIIPTQTIEQAPAQAIARELIDAANNELQRRVNNHRAAFAKFWRSAATPDEILEAMGTDAVLWLSAASESVQHVARLAAIAGKELTDFLPPEDFLSPREFIPHEDGTVTLSPPTPEPEPTDEP